MVTRQMCLMGFFVGVGLCGCPSVSQTPTDAGDSGVRVDVQPGTDVQPGVDVQPGTDVQPATDVMDAGTDVQPATDVQPMTDVQPGVDVQPGTDVQPATDIPVDVQPDMPAMTFTFVGAALSGGPDGGPHISFQMNWTGTLHGSATGPGGGTITFDGTIR